MIISVKLNIFIAPKIKTIDVKNKVIASILHNFASSYCSFSFTVNFSLKSFKESLRTTNSSKYIFLDEILYFLFMVINAIGRE